MMDAHNHVVRSSSLADVAELTEGGMRFSKTGSVVPSELNAPDQFVVLEGKAVRVRASSASAHVNRSIESVESEFHALKQSVNDSFETDHDNDDAHNFPSIDKNNNHNGKSRMDGIRQSKEISRQARRIMELESFISNLPAETAAGEEHHAETNKPINTNSASLPSSRPGSRGGNTRASNHNVASQRSIEANFVDEESLNADQFDLNFITPKNHTTTAVAPSMSTPQSGHRTKTQPVSRHFFASPAENSAVAGTDEALVLELEDPLQDTLDFAGTNVSISSVGSLKSSVKKRGPPSSLAQRLALGSTERRKLHSANNSVGANNGTSGGDSVSKVARQQSDELSVISGGSADVGGQPTGTASSLARKLHTARAHPYPTSASPNKDDALGYGNVGDGMPCGGAVHTPKVHVPVPVSYYWRDKQAALRSAGKQDIFLFVAHDNPQLGKTVATQLHCDSPISGSSKYASAGASIGGGGMLCMIECKDKCTPVNIHFILGKIVYSGEYAAIEGADALQPRGSGCLVVTELRAVRGDIKRLTTQQKSDIIEVDLVNMPEGFSVPLRSEEDLRALLRPCTAHVDMILDPYHTSYQWYPYWEGARRMAPQFRSKGIGYLRLGDDMSQYGTAFLSLDAGVTYLDEGATSIVAQANAPSPFTTMSNNLRLSRTFSGTSGGSGGGATPGTGLRADTLGGTTGKLKLNRTPSFGRGTSSELSSPSSQLSSQVTRLASDDIENLYNGANSGGTSAKSSPRSPRAVQAGVLSGGGSKKVTYEAGTSGGATATDGVKRSPRGLPSAINTTTAASSATSSNSVTPRSTSSASTSATPSTFLKKTSSFSAVKAVIKEDPAWEQCLTYIRECTHTIKSGDTLKWTERVEILQKLAYAMGEILHFASIESFVCAHNGLVCEVISLLTDALSKQNNPHVLVATVACIRCIEYGTVLVSQCWLPYRALLIEVVHTLRSTNKLVQECTHECLLHLYQCRSITFTVLCTGNLLDDIIIGTHGTSGGAKKGITKTTVHGSAGASGGNGGSGSAGSAKSVSVNTKITTAANTAKVVQWMDAAAACEVENCVFLCVGGGAGTKVDTGTVIRTCTVLLSHREEITREATITLISTLLTVDIIQNLSTGGLGALLALSRKLSDLQRKASTGVDKDIEAKQKVVEQSVSETAVALLAEIRTMSARSYDKIVQLLAQAVSKHALNAAVTNAAKIAETAVVLSPRSTHTTASAAATVMPVHTSSRVHGNDTGTVGDVSPRTTVVRVAGSPRAGRIEALKTSPRPLHASTPAGGVHDMEAADLKSTSNASTPPYNYTNAASAASTTPLSTPRETFVPVTRASKSTVDLATTNAYADIDMQKMKQGLQGIKNIRARSANGSRGNSAGTVSTVDTTVDGASTGSGVSSRANSASRSRRRIATAANSGADDVGNSDVIASGGSGGSSVGVYSGEKAAVQRVGELLTPRRLSRDYSATGSSLVAGSVVSPVNVTADTASHVRSSSSRPSSGKRVAPPSTISASSSSGSAAVDVTKALQNLGGMWYEAQLLLRQVPSTDAGWEHLSQVVKTAPTFFADLSALSSFTKYPKGAILRHVLPFDENTSSNDQAKGRVGGGFVSAGRDAELGAVMPSPLKGHDRALKQLAQSAMELRSVIRVKMADEADVNQAASASAMLNKFLTSVQNVSQQSGVTTMQLINKLDTMS